MADEITKEVLAEVNQAFAELKKTVEAKSMDQEKIERINTVLDSYETKNQELVTAAKQIEAHEHSLKAFKEELETKGIEAGKLREQVDQFQLTLAKSIKGASNEDHRDSVEYKAFEGFVLNGPDSLDLETKAELRTDSATEGGVLVTSEMESQIVKQITEIDPMRQISRVRPTANKSLVVPIETAIPVAQYEGEAETSTESIQAYGSETLTAFRLTHTVPITRDMLMDSAFDMNAEIMDASSRAFAFGEGNGFVIGTGFKQPYGFLVDSRITQVSSQSTTGGVISPDDVLWIQGQLKTGYNGTLIMNRRTHATLRMAQSSSGGYLWAPGVNGPAMASMGGSPYVLSNSMPDAGVTDNLALAFGDFGMGYLIVDRTATEVIRDDYTRKKEAIVEFTIHRWNTGKVVLPEAIKILKLETATP